VKYLYTTSIQADVSNFFISINHVLLLIASSKTKAQTLNVDNYYLYSIKRTCQIQPGILIRQFLPENKTNTASGKTKLKNHK
jgi:hypothetical protein